jgi:hypothetical protein
MPEDDGTMGDDALASRKFLDALSGSPRMDTASTQHARLSAARR